MEDIEKLLTEWATIYVEECEKANVKPTDIGFKAFCFKMRKIIRKEAKKNGRKTRNNK